MMRTSLNNWTRGQSRGGQEILTFCRLDGFSCVLSMILMATSFPVGRCFASLTLAKFPFPIVFSSYDATVSPRHQVIRLMTHPVTTDMWFFSRSAGLSPGLGHRSRITSC